MDLIEMRSNPEYISQLKKKKNQKKKKKKKKLQLKTPIEYLTVDELIDIYNEQEEVFKVERIIYFKKK